MRLHSTVGNVFKVVIFSVLLMMLLDTGLTVAQNISINDKITTYGGLLSEIVTENNHVPASSIALFNTAFDDMVEAYPMITAISWNYSNTLPNKDGVNRSPVNANNAGDYGEEKHIVITVTVQPYIYLIGDSLDVFGKYALAEQVRVFEFPAPCLQYQR